MSSWSRAGWRAGATSAVIGAAVLVAACGSSSSSSSQSSAAQSPSTSATKAISISTAKGSGGSYLVGASGRALYLWAADGGGKSACSGACAHVWTPVVTHGTPVASGGVNAADLGTVARTDGSKQVTYMGHPLYYYLGDHGAGTTTGQGSNSFGAKWWLVAPSGSAITAVSSTGAKSSSSSSSSSGGGWG